jgi:hypothetical protein
MDAALNDSEEHQVFGSKDNHRMPAHQGNSGAHAPDSHTAPRRGNLLGLFCQFYPLVPSVVDFAVNL